MGYHNPAALRQGTRRTLGFHPYVIDIPPMHYKALRFLYMAHN